MRSLPDAMYSFFAFSLVRADGVDFENSREKQFTWLSEQGFDVVEHKMVTRETVEKNSCLVCRRNREQSDSVGRTGSHL